MVSETSLNSIGRISGMDKKNPCHFKKAKIAIAKLARAGRAAKRLATSQRRVRNAKTNIASKEKEAACLQLCSPAPSERRLPLSLKDLPERPKSKLNVE